MSDDYTPTTVNVRAVYASGVFFQTGLTSYDVDAVRGAAEFDEWLAEHDRQVAETAWDEAARAVIEFEESVISDHPTNPYRSIALLGVQEESKA